MTKPVNWDKVRGAYERGERVTVLAQLNCVKAAEIRQRAAAEGWGHNAGEDGYRAEQERKRAAQVKRMAAAGVLNVLPPDERQALVQGLLVRYLQGDSLTGMSSELGANRLALYYALLGGADDDLHHGLITQALTAKVARADALLESAKGPVEIARAREMARFARMDLERRRPALYGQQTRHEHTHKMEDLGERLRRARERVIEHAEPVKALPNPEAE